MNSTNMNTDIAALNAQGLTNLFCRIADTYYDGMIVDAASTLVLVEAGLVRRTRSRAHLTAYGWSVATRIAALGGAERFGSRKLVLRDKERGEITLSLAGMPRVVVGAMGSEPTRYIGKTEKQARHIARYGGV